MSTLEKHPLGSYRTPSLEHATVGDAMHQGVMTCDPDATLTEVARIMATHHVHFIGVLGLSTSASGEVLTWRVITDLDLVRGGVRPGESDTARTLARHPVVTVDPGTPLRHAADLMLGRGLSHLLVISPETQHPVGVLSTLDVAGTLAWGEV